MNLLDTTLTHKKVARLTSGPMLKRNECKIALKWQSQAGEISSHVESSDGKLCSTTASESFTREGLEESTSFQARRLIAERVWIYVLRGRSFPHKEVQWLLWWRVSSLKTARFPDSQPSSGAHGDLRRNLWWSYTLYSKKCLLVGMVCVIFKKKIDFLEKTFTWFF